MNNYNPTMEGNALKLLAEAKNFFVDSWDKIILFFGSYKWQEILFDIRIVFILVSALFLILIIFLLVKIYILSKFKKSLRKKPKKSTNRKWIKIENRIKAGTIENYKLAVIDADNLYNKVLKNIGITKEKELSNLDELKKAKKLKNQIVEDKKYELSKEEASLVVNSFEKASKELIEL